MWDFGSAVNRYDWNPWFAWYPVALVGEVHEGPGRDVSYFPIGRHAWLRWIECRIVGAVAPNGDLTGYWEYRL